MSKPGILATLVSVFMLTIPQPGYSDPSGAGQADALVQAYFSGPDFVQTSIYLHARHELYVRAWCYGRDGTQLRDSADFEFQATGGATNVDEPATGPTIEFDLAERATGRIEFIPQGTASETGHCHMVWTSDTAPGGPALSGHLALLQFDAGTGVNHTSIARLPDF